jgi:hypothetical protein
VTTREPAPGLALNSPPALRDRTALVAFVLFVITAEGD